MNPNFGIVISHYNKREKNDLNKLLGQLQPFKKQVIVVINRDDIGGEDHFLYESTLIVERPNIGMNIGGWSAGIKYCNNFEYVVFLQDECDIISFDFFEKYIELLNDSQIGMVGESINPKWVYEWEFLRATKLNYSISNFTSNPVSRIDYYHQCFARWNIKPGNTGSHLRALTWGFKNSFLQKIKQFPIGGNKEECIASEIAVSKLVEQHGLSIRQSNERPFSFVRHKEWHQDGWSKIR
jgi:hypothetical protein